MRAPFGRGLMVVESAPVPDARAAAFVAARRAARALAGYPGQMPQTETEAYAVQDAARALWPDVVAGWKVGLVQPPFDAAMGRSRLFGPIFAGNVVAAGAAGAAPHRFGCILGGFSAVEAEYVLRLAHDVAPATGWTDASAAGLVEAVFAGVEIAGSPFRHVNAHGPLVTISDFGNNAGLLLGNRIRGGLRALEAATCAVLVDGVEIGAGAASSIPGGPLGSLVELLNHMGRRGETLAGGCLVSTGAVTGVHQVRAGRSAIADFGPDGRIHVDLVEAGPMVTPC